jgi:shikimate kinase / 3-dehydroquinate synthase
MVAGTEKVMLPQYITLTGFMGSGKSSVARAVAAKLGWEAIDGDDVVEQREGGQAGALIDQHGEPAFRRMEAATYAALADKARVVIASGGGAPTYADTRRELARAGLVVHLDAPFDACAERIQAQVPPIRRPLFDDNPDGARELLERRKSIYKLADFIVDTQGRNVDEVAAEVVRLYQVYGEDTFDQPGRLDRITAAYLQDATSVIRTASANYPSYVSWGALEHLGDYVKGTTGARRAFIVSDENVLARWGEVATGSLRAAGLETASITLPPGDSSKSIEQTSRVYDWLASQRAERRDVVVALGGGVAGDFGGFIAGTYLRGMPYVQAPTSLLAMVDASIGGKTAVNHAGAKNIVGLFNQPRAVVADVSTLATLPRRALIEGLGEVIKHAFIRDAELLALLEDRLDDLLALDPELTTQVVARNIQIKGDVVSQDERETGGVRELLNYGHTLGHAFEAAGGYDALLHGEAVSVGMMAAAKIGVRVGITPEPLVERQRVLLERAGLPLKPPPELDRARIRNALAMDKKIVSGTQRWVLLEDVGRPIVTADVPASVVEAVLDEMLA